jgi:iron(III) transport system ATP-binding protein
MHINIENAVIGYDKTTIINGLDLEINLGEFFTLLGPSGCGKTTLLRTIAGFVSLQSGTLKFGDKDVTNTPAYKRNIGMVFQDYALFPDKTVFDNVAYGLRARKIVESEIKIRVLEGLEKVGLSALANRRPAELSGGQRQRVALIRALVIKPEVLLMDEPLSNLDAKLRHQVRETIVDLQREAGITTIFVTHDQDEALAMSHRIGVMNKGKLEQIGTPREIYQTPETVFTASFIGAANIIGNMMIRPENVSLSDGGDALILKRQYLGATTHYEVSHEGQVIHATLHGAGHERFAVNERVKVVMPADMMRALKL